MGLSAYWLSKAAALEASQSWYARAGAVAEEVLFSMRTVASFGAEKRETARYAATLQGAAAGGAAAGAGATRGAAGGGPAGGADRRAGRRPTAADGTTATVLLVDGGARDTERPSRCQREHRRGVHVPRSRGG